MIPTHKFSVPPEQSQALKPKKDKNSLHNLPKLDKTQLYFNSYHTQTPVAIKVPKANTEGPANPKPYFMNNNLKRGVAKVKTSKDQNKSITNFLDITISQNYNKEYKASNMNTESSNKGKVEEKECTLEIRSGEAKFSKPHIKHKNSCGNSLTFEKNFLATDKNFRPSLYESASSKSKEYFHQAYYNNKIQKPEEKKQNQTNELEVILTEASENTMNEFPNPETKQAIFNLFSRDVLLGSKNFGANSNANHQDIRSYNGNQELKASAEKKEKEELENLGCNFIVKNQDTGNIINFMVCFIMKYLGEVYDIRDMEKMNKLTETNKPEYFEKLKKRQNIIWQDWW